MIFLKQFKRYIRENLDLKRRLSYLDLDFKLMENGLRIIVCCRNCYKSDMKKALGETQTLHAGCRKAEPEIFAQPQTPSRGGGGRRTAKI